MIGPDDPARRLVIRPTSHDDCQVPPPSPASPPDRSSEPDPAKLLALATDLAGQAAALLMDGLGRARTSVRTKSSPTDMVTEMDRASERLIVDGIRAARPDDAVLGEEGTNRRGTSGLRWVIDPLDGTTNYLYGHAGFSVSVAVERSGPAGGADLGIMGDDPGATTLAGVVIDPLHRDVFAATAGGGATRNGEPIACSRQTEPGRALVATGFAYDPARRGRQAQVVARMISQIRDIRRMGAAAIDLCSVAFGRVDAYYERSLGPWDYAAAALIASEAGALIGNLDGGPASPAFVFAAPPTLFEPLREILATAGAADT
jgi:myo-inositol-1(or 4)-monophosphatase